MPRKKSFKGAAGKFALQNRRKGGGFNPFSVFRSLFASSADRKPLTNKMSTTETAIWYMLFYYFVGSGLYTRLFEKQFTTHESIYFLTVTMTVRCFSFFLSFSLFFSLSLPCLLTHVNIHQCTPTRVHLNSLCLNYATRFLLS